MPPCQHATEYIPGETELWWRGDAFESLPGELVLGFCEEEWLLPGWDIRENEKAALLCCRQRNGLDVDDCVAYMRAMGIVMIASTMNSQL